jgi:hypothetical protein
MKLDISSVRRYCGPSFLVRRVSLLVAALAVLAMSVVTVAVSTYGGAADGIGPRPVVVATDRHTATTTRTGVPSAGAPVQVPAWQGGGWPGMGPFHGQGWPG